MNSSSPEEWKMVQESVLGHKSPADEYFQLVLFCHQIILPKHGVGDEEQHQLLLPTNVFVDNMIIFFNVQK